MFLQRTSVQQVITEHLSSQNLLIKRLRASSHGAQLIEADNHEIVRNYVKKEKERKGGKEGRKGRKMKRKKRKRKKVEKKKERKRERKEGK